MRMSPWRPALAGGPWCTFIPRISLQVACGRSPQRRGEVRVWYPGASGTARWLLGHLCPWISEGSSGVAVVAMAPFACAVLFSVCF